MFLIQTTDAATTGKWRGIKFAHWQRNSIFQEFGGFGYGSVTIDLDNLSSNSLNVGLGDASL
jgi:hypothetical protein